MNLVRRLALTGLDHRIARLPLVSVDLAGPALVVVPHPDDETLCCGGTIALKRRAGTAVSIVVLTDGGAAFGRELHTEEIVGLRERELLAAANELGVAASDVHFLRLPDGELGGYVDAAVDAVSALISLVEPSEVYVTSATDPHVDHRAAAEIVARSARRSGRAMRVLEGPVWSWWTWPFVATGFGIRGERRRFLRQSIRLGFGWVVPRRHRVAVDVSSVADVKRAALDQHRSQITRGYAGDPTWVTLTELAGGDFVRRLLSDRELFAVIQVDDPAP